MTSCTFFGHHDCPKHIKPKIKAVLCELIKNSNVDMFYVGNHGAFDLMVYSTLLSLAEIFPHIKHTIVLAYMPGQCALATLPIESLLPGGIENVPKRFAISWRNEWMLAKADFVVAYVTHDWGGAARFTAKAIRQGKAVINIAEMER